jgi:ubiquinone/menaquinone biosynthesis C-methylase UbiE
LERHRLIWLFLKYRTNLFSTRLKLLYVAPEYCFRKNFQRFKNIQIISIDLENPIAMMKMDITDLKFNDSLLDCILCLHVLEHVEDDRKAIKDLYRVLKPNGWAILQVPILRDKTFEDPSIKTREQRLKYFGQEDHVREYGLDFKDRLTEAGFQVKVETLKEEISPNSVFRYRLLTTDKNLQSVYFCTKPAGQSS